MPVLSHTCAKMIIVSASLCMLDGSPASNLLVICLSRVSAYYALDPATPSQMPLMGPQHFPFESTEPFV